MTLYIEQECKVNFPFDHQRLANDVVEAALCEEKFPLSAELNLLLVSEAKITELNRDFRQVASATDVLSFPMLNYDKPGDFSMLADELVRPAYTDPQTNNVLLGDIVLCVTKVEEQASAYGHSSKREYAFLILHSMLHLFGYDHNTNEEAKIMEDKQNQILEKMQITR